MPESKVLIICRHNSGRSQIAEAYLKQFAGEYFEVESAGLQPAERVNPLVVTVMQEAGIDLSAKKPQSVFALFKQGHLYEHVITVCDANDMQCPVFPGITRRWHIPFPDPAAVAGSPEEKLAAVRVIRDQIKAWLDPEQGDFIRTMQTGSSKP
jgi:arsenate reductase (thioredoxin)